MIAVLWKTPIFKNIVCFLETTSEKCHLSSSLEMEDHSYGSVWSNSILIPFWKTSEERLPHSRVLNGMGLSLQINVGQFSSPGRVF